MPSIEDRVVKISFDNASFEHSIADTIDSLSELNDALDNISAQNSLQNLNVQANQLDSGAFSGIGAAVSNISEKFSTLGVIGFTVIQNLTNAAIGFATKVGTDVITPIFTGGLTRAKNIEQAKFMFEGLGIDIEQGMASALAAVQGTAFGLDEAAKAAAQFGASGIQVGDQMTSALRGVAGAAALTGRSFTEIADIFAGSAGTGIVNNLDLQQFATRGLNAASAVAKVMGITEQQVHEMASAGELDFQTFAAAMDQAFGQHATEANKTFSGALANMHAALSRLGAAIITPELTNFRDIFNSISPAVDKFTSAIRPAIDMFSFISRNFANQKISFLDNLNFEPLKAAMPDIIASMANIFRLIQQIISLGKDAFGDIFPPQSVPLIQRIASVIKELTDAVTLTYGGLFKVKSLFQGVFAILSIGWTVVKEGAKFLFDLGKSIANIFGKGATDGIKTFGDFFIKLQASLVKGGGIKDFFDNLANSLKKPLELLARFKDKISEFFHLFDNGLPDKLNLDLGRFGDRIDSIRSVIATVLGAISGPLETAFLKVTDILGRIFSTVADWASTFGDKVAKLFKKGDFSPVLDVLNTGLLISIALLLKKFIDNGLKFFVKGTFDIAGNVLERLSQGLNELTGTLQAIQTNLKANALLKIAIAIGILAASLLVLSLIDSVALSKALAAMAVGFAELMGSFAIFTKLVTGPKAAASFALTAAGLILLAGAMLILSVAALILSTIDWDGIAKGLAGIAGGLVAMVGALRLMPKDAKLISAGIALGLMAGSLVVLALAMKLFATMDWEELKKGFIGVVGGLAAMTAALNLMPSNADLISAGFALLEIAVAMNILAVAMKIFATMKWEQIEKGLVGVLGGLAAMALVLNLLPTEKLISMGFAIDLVAAALIAIGIAMKIISSLSWEELVKAMYGIGGALLIIAAAMFVMEGALPGAAALAIVAGSLVILAGVLKTIATMSVEDIAKSLITVALALGIIAGISVLLIEAVPAIAALGAAILILGAGFALAGVGIFLISKGFEAFVRISKQAAEALPVFLEVLSKSVAAFVKGLTEGIIDSIKPLIKAAPLFAKLIGKLISVLLDEIIKLSPKVGVAIGVLIEELFKVIRSYAAEYIKTGFFIIKKLLEGISNNIGPIVHIVGDIITKFLDAVDQEAPRVIDGLVETFKTIWLGTAEALGEVAATIMVGTGGAFIEGFLNGVENELNGPVFEFVTGILGDVLGWIGDALSTLFNKGVDLITGLWNGINSFIGTVTTFFTGLGDTIAGWVGDAFNFIKDKGGAIIDGLFKGITDAWTTVTNWLGDLAHFIRVAIGDVRDWLFNIGKRIIEGLWDGMKDAWHEVEGWLGGLGDIARHLKGPPEKDAVLLVENGMLIMQGLHKGMMTAWVPIETWLGNIDPSENLKPNLAENMTRVLSDVVDKMSDISEFAPTITPVLDLSQVQKDAKNLGQFLKVNELTPNFSIGQAQFIAKSSNPNQASDQPKSDGPNGVSFEQNIYAPTRLSTSDIYKQTRNQITIAKEELSIP